jgi:hypothetical protein
LGLGQSIDTRNEVKSQYPQESHLSSGWNLGTTLDLEPRGIRACFCENFTGFLPIQIQRTFVYYFIIATTSAFNSPGSSHKHEYYLLSIIISEEQP